MVKCPNCNQDLVDVYMLGWIHLAYQTCYDGVRMIEAKQDDGNMLYWYEVDDLEGRNMFLKKIKEIVRLESNNGISDAQKPQRQDITQIDQNTEVVVNKVITQKKKFLSIYKPYYN